MPRDDARHHDGPIRQRDGGQHSTRPAALSDAAALPSLTASLTQDARDEPLFAHQWHLGSPTGFDINIGNVWDDYTGAGIHVAVIDTGIDPTHPDLDGNIDPVSHMNSRTGATGATSGNPQNGSDNHGTAVAGVIAAEDNNIGVVGVAYGATLVPIYTPLTTSAFALNGLVFAENFDVVNNSWGYGGGGDPFYVDFEDGVRRSGEDASFQAYGTAIRNTAEGGRDGLGTIIVFSAGNHFEIGDDVNLSNFTNTRYAITVGATDENGDLALFSTPGAAILISAPGVDIATTDRPGSAGFVPNQEPVTLGSSDYVEMDGTSFAAPIVSAVAALMLEANRSLGARDVQEILAYSARTLDATVDDWQTNGATNWNGGGLTWSHYVGSGLVDAHAAVRLAETWFIEDVFGMGGASAHTFNNEATASASAAPNAAIPDNSEIGVSSTLIVTDNIVIDHVEVHLNITHTWIGDLAVELIAPTGMSAVLMLLPYLGTASENNVDFTFMSTFFWGETSAGEWSLHVYDFGPGDAGTLVDWQFTAYGDAVSVDDTYYFTNEFGGTFAEGDDTRRTLSDNEGNDTINIAAVESDSTVDLDGGTAQIAGRTLTLAGGTQIENVLAGDGDDVLIGSTATNMLHGGRGDDTLLGVDGDDVLMGGAGNDRLDGGDGNDTLDGGAGTDLLLGGAGDDWLIGLSGTLDGGDGIDTAVLTFGDNADSLVFGADGSGGYALSGDMALPGLISIEAIGIDLAGGDDSLLVTSLLGTLAPTVFVDGGVGDDVIDTSLSGLAFWIDGGEGADSVTAGLANDTIRLGDGADYADGGNGEDWLTGDNGDDVLLGGGGDDTIDGGGGDDTLDGGSGHNTLIGGSGDDFLVAGDGTLDGGSGFDRVLLERGTGDETVAISASGDRLVIDGVVLDATLIDIEGVELRLGDDNNVVFAGAIAATGAGSLTVLGGGGSDQIDGTALDVALLAIAGDGHDQLAGGSGDDRLVGGGGNDRLFAGQGNDTIEGGAGIDTLDLSAATSGTVLDLSLNAAMQMIGGGLGGESVSSIEVVEGSSFADEISGSVNADQLHGGGGDDILRGGAGDDTLDGGTGSDVLQGGDGRDVLRGGAGDDRLVLEESLDTYDGGSGFDSLSIQASGLVDGRDWVFPNVSGIEAFDLSDDDDDVLIIDLNWVRQLSAGGSIAITGDGGDTVMLDGAWIEQGVVERHGGSWRGYTLDDAEVLVSPVVGSIAVEDLGYIEDQELLPFPAVQYLDDMAADEARRLATITNGRVLNQAAFGGGDINADGIDDFILETYSTTYVVFGREGATPVPLSFNSLNGTDGFRIVSQPGSPDPDIAHARFLGDIDGDGIDDLGWQMDGQSAFQVVFGHTGPFDASYATAPSVLESDMSVIATGAGSMNRGAIEAAGDVNGDGLDDFIVGMQYSKIDGNLAGTAYVVYGGESVRDGVDLADLDVSNGFRIGGGPVGGRLGAYVAGIGDINDDGFDDVMVASQYEDFAHVVFGGPAGGSFLRDVNALDGTNGFIARGPSGDYLGWDIEPIGDFNGDGIEDVILTASLTSDGTNAYVLFGKAGGFGVEIDLTELDGSDGFEIVHPRGDGFSQVAALGDFNGDGLDDVAFGGVRDNRDVGDQGGAFVVFGTTSIGTDRVLVTELTAGAGAAFLGDVQGARIGTVIAGAGDFNGDGIPDLIVGGRSKGHSGDNSYDVYVVYGAGARFDEVGADYVLHNGEAAGQSMRGTILNDLLLGMEGNDILDGGSGNDILVGGSGDDVTSGGAGNDIHQGGAGDDRLGDSAGNDLLDGGDGDDVLIAGAEAQVSLAEALDIKPADRLLTLSGGAGHDVGIIEGYSLNETLAVSVLDDARIKVEDEAHNIVVLDDVENLVIEALAGNDRVTIADLAGSALLQGTVLGGDGDDVLDSFAAGRSFVLDGGAGDDTILTGSGSDILDGGSGDDVLVVRGALVPSLAADAGGVKPRDLEIAVAGGDGEDTATLAAYDVDDTISITVVDGLLQVRDEKHNTITFRDVETILINALGGDDAITIAGLDGSPDALGVVFGGAGNDVVDASSSGSAVTLDGGVGDDVLVGGEGEDVLIGGAGNDLLRGQGGDDTLLGGAGDDVLEGGIGNDVLTGGLGSDALDGGAGEDWADYGAAGYAVSVQLLRSLGLDRDSRTERDFLIGIENVAGSAHDDVLTGDDQRNILAGNAGNDMLSGQAGDDILLGGAGNDLLRGQSGDDTLLGGAGDDRLEGEIGDDVFLGGAGNDVLIGGDGSDWADYGLEAQGKVVNLRFGTARDGDSAGNDDTLDSIENVIGSAHADILLGDAGANTLLGGGGADQLSGKQGDDVLEGGAGDDVLAGEAGQDTLRGGEGDDTLDGGADDDVLAGGAGNDVLRGGDGSDWVDYGQGSQAWKVQLHLSQALDADRSGEKDRLEDIENVIGSDGDDVLFGTDAANTLLGGGGDDILTGMQGDDVLDGGAGNDRLRGQSGDDTLVGGAGDDRLEGATGNDFLVGGAGNDILLGGGGSDWTDYTQDGQAKLVNLRDGYGRDRSGDIEHDVLVDIENVIGSVHDDVITGDNGANTLFGGAGDDLLTGLQGDDVLEGGAGNDRLRGQSDNDTLRGGDGDDTLEGSFGDDVLSGGAGNDILLGGDGSDWVDYSSDDKAKIVFLRSNFGRDRFGAADSDTLEDIENVIGTGKSDVIVGDDADNTLLGGDGDDQLTGNLGDDHLGGGDGNDRLRGQSGDDVLRGGDGDDRIEGGVGNDQLFGGRGNDVFLFVDGDGHDMIRDFDHGDRVELAVAGFSTFADILAVADDGGGSSTIVLAFDDHTTLTLIGLTLGELSEGMFVF